MGHAILLSSDDTELFRLIGQDPAGSARQLADLLRGAFTSRTTSRDDPWQVAGTLHSSSSACLSLDPDELRLLNLNQPAPPPSGTWQPASRRTLPALDPGNTGITSRTLGLPSVAQPAAGLPITLRSAWWAYADSLPWDLNDHDASHLAQQLSRAFAVDGSAEIAVSRHVNALTRAGGITGGSPCPVFWSGNRLCGPESLLPWEREMLLR